MRLTAILLIGSLMAGCASTTTSPKASETKTAEAAWHWEWASSTAGWTDGQLERDKYTCLQDYRQTASPYIDRPQRTELQMMLLHQEVCLNSKGWKKVAGDADQSQYFWTPNGWMKLPAGTQLQWYWKGQPIAERTERWIQDSEHCDHVIGASASLTPSGRDTRRLTRVQLEGWYACLWRKDWQQLPKTEYEKKIAEAEATIKEARARAAKEIAVFASDPAHPYFDEVSGEIMFHLKTSQVEGVPRMSLAEAYEKASMGCTTQALGTQVIKKCPDPAHPYFEKVQAETMRLISQGLSAQQAYEKASVGCTTVQLGTQLARTCP